MPFPARALALAGAALFVAGSAEAGALTLAVGQAHREAASGTVSNVVVVDPAVADVTVIDQHSVIVVGKGRGFTEILATDRAGHVLIDDLVTIGGMPDNDHVTIYRGVTGSDYACAPLCRVLDQQGLAAFNVAQPAASPASPASVTPSAYGSGSAKSAYAHP